MQDLDGPVRHRERLDPEHLGLPGPIKIGGHHTWIAGDVAGRAEERGAEVALDLELLREEREGLRRLVRA